MQNGVEVYKASGAAALCGFDSASNFAKMFKRFYNCAPTGVQKQELIKAPKNGFPFFGVFFQSPLNNGSSTSAYSSKISGRKIFQCRASLSESPNT